MADVTDYPQVIDVMNFFTSAGLTVPAEFDLATPAQEAQEEWEQRTGWFPFLNIQGDETLVLDSSDRGWGWGGAGYGAFGGFGTWRSGSRILDLECGVLSVSSLTINGQALVEDVDYRLMPRNARRQGWPFTYIDFFGYSFAWAWIGTGEVWLTAKCGYCTALPARVWSAVLRRAVARCAPQIALTISGGLADIKRGDEEIKFASGMNSGPMSEQIRKWDADFEALLIEFNRVVL